MASKVRVYGKAQNRTALGIAHAYMVILLLAGIAAFFAFRKPAVDFLVGRGIDASRLEAVGKGSSEPLDVNNPEANRRTEFIVLE
ncbi:MAG: hypothetical protein J6Q73_09450 [Bacteroidaceae bacterium]|nr:hypothetical protein [Bacteroidaceae bacterium]